MTKAPAQESDVIELLKVHYQIHAQSAQLLTLGADPNAFVYKITADKDSYFVKIKYGNTDDIYSDLMALFRDLDIKEIIFPLAANNGTLYTQLDHFKLIVYPFIEGQNGFEKSLTRNQWIELGKVLKKIHTKSLSSSFQEKIRKENFSSKWREIVKFLYSKMDIVPKDDQISIDFKSFFNTNSTVISRLVNASENLSKIIQPDSTQSVLCHADIHAGNVLISEDEKFYIVDWDDPMMAPKERDLMFIGGGIGNVWNSPVEVDYFYEGYGEPGIDKTMLSYYRHERVIEDIALFPEEILSNNIDPQSRLISLKHFKDMFEMNGVIDIALNHK